MPKFQKIPVRVGDSVKVITGSDKNKIGKVLKISPRNGKILVSGINLKFKHLNIFETDKVHVKVYAIYTVKVGCYRFL